MLKIFTWTDGLIKCTVKNFKELRGRLVQTGIGMRMKVKWNGNESVGGIIFLVKWVYSHSLYATFYFWFLFSSLKVANQTPTSYYHYNIEIKNSISIVQNNK